MRSVYRFLVVVFLLSGLIAGRAFAQGGATGAISGVVVDSSGGSIADAAVEIFDSRTDLQVRKLNSASDGTFTATLLPPGTCYVVVNKPGFAQSRADNIEVHVTETTRITISLKPGFLSPRKIISNSSPSPLAPTASSTLPRSSAAATSASSSTVSAKTITIT